MYLCSSSNTPLVPLLHMPLSLPYYVFLCYLSFFLISPMICQALLELAQRYSMAYELQDVVCLKCRMVKNDNVAAYCACSGTFTNTRKRESFCE